SGFRPRLRRGLEAIEEGSDARAEVIEVVPALERARDAAAADALGRLADREADALEVLDAEVEAADGVVAVRVEAGRDEQDLRLERGDGGARLGERVQELVGRRQRVEREVPRRARAARAAGLVVRAGPGVERVAVERGEEDARIVPEDVL